MLPASLPAQSGGDEVCFGFEFGTWKPTLDWKAAGHDAFPDSSRLQHSPTGRDWAFGPDKTDTSFVLIPAWWPAGVVDNDAATGCSTDVAASFAWWVGKWNYAVPGYDPGTSSVAASNGGCTLVESFVDRTGKQQHTTIQYDSSADTWKRHVVDPFRTYDSVGRFANDGTIVFNETSVERESYHPTDHDHVHFIGESSKDGGKTWAVTFDATYTRQP